MTAASTPQRLKDVRVFRWFQTPATFKHLQNRAELARYAHLPLAAVGGDWRSATADALFGRALRDAGQLLWAVDPATPDLRGAEQRDEGQEAAFTDDQPRVDVRASPPVTSAHFSHVLLPSAFTCLSRW